MISSRVHRRGFFAPVPVGSALVAGPRQYANHHLPTGCFACASAALPPCYHSPAMALPNRQTSRLRFGRTSAPGASYFITNCTKDRAAILTATNTGRTVADSLLALHSSGEIQLAAATIMPDHVHLLFTLGDRLRVGQVVGKFKTLARNMGRATWRWQQDGFEHQLRDVESMEDYGFYMFMNPYRAGLCPLAAPWPWWLCPQPSLFRFLSARDQNQAVPSEWLGLSDQIGSRITTGD